MSDIDNVNHAWELMIFELNGNKLNDFGSQAYVENALSTAGCVVVARTQHAKLTDRLRTPDWRDRFLAS